MEAKCEALEKDVEVSEKNRDEAEEKHEALVEEVKAAKAELEETLKSIQDL